MTIATTIVREYANHEAYARDAARLARLGYVVTSVVEHVPPLGWVQRVRRKLFASASICLRASYRDQGAAM